MILPISVRGVSKSYPAGSGLRALFSRNQRRTPALCDVTFDVASGECFGILGLNGAGKTTLLKLISTLLVPDSGALSVLGYDVRREGAEVRARLGICSANERSFYGRLSVRENISCRRNC
jgi:ABC-2 type transport system ATP-binding protein